MERQPHPATTNRSVEYEPYHAVWPQIKALGTFLLSKVPVPGFVDRAIDEAVKLPPENKNEQQLVLFED